MKTRTIVMILIASAILLIIGNASGTSEICAYYGNSLPECK